MPVEEKISTYKEAIRFLNRELERSIRKPTGELEGSTQKTTGVLTAGSLTAFQILFFAGKTMSEMKAKPDVEEQLSVVDQRKLRNICDELGLEDVLFAGRDEASRSDDCPGSGQEGDEGSESEADTDRSGARTRPPSPSPDDEQDQDPRSVMTGY